MITLYQVRIYDTDQCSLSRGIFIRLYLKKLWQHFSLFHLNFHIYTYLRNW